MSTDVFLSIREVSRSFQLGDTQVRALNTVSLEVKHGEFVAIMGQSGSGKSTLMNILGCLDRPSLGTYFVGEVDVSTLDLDELASLRRETFGFIFQRYNLLTNLNAEENVAVPAIYKGLAYEERRHRSRELLQQLGLGERFDHLPSQLSGGQQQRVSIARALINNPPVILADEPTGALDSASGQSVLALLGELHAQGRTVLLITHDEAVASHAKRIIRLRDGIIVEDSGSHEQVTLTESRVPIDLKSGLSSLASIREAFRMALHSLQSHMMRTGITLLGIVIGVAAVVAMLAIGTGSKNKIVNQFSSMGTNLVLIRPGAPGFRGGDDIITLTPADAALIATIKNVEGVVPERSKRMTVRVGNVDYLTQVQGVSEEFPRVRDWPLNKGSFFSESDKLRYAPVAVLGETVRKNLFPEGNDPIGTFIILGAVPFEVVGVLNAKGASPMGTDQDDVILIPYTTGLVRLFGKSYLNSVTVRVSDISAIDEVENSIRTTLTQRHHTDDFSIRNMASLLETVSATQNTFTVMLGSVAAISLIVGGIGVMNIMLVSVTERTREIGIRMATGARIRDILFQFNIESALVCAIGGVLGLVMGFGAGFALQAFGMAVEFSVWPAALAFSCACGTGLIFGYLPARKAAHLDPVVALASE